MTTLTTVLCVLLAVGIHYEMLRLLTGLMPRLPIPRRPRVAIAIVGGIAAHMIEAGVFALAYGFLIGLGGHGELIGMDQGFFANYYFSIVTFTSVGFGDVTPNGALRILAGTEALTGLVLITWTASYSFLQMQRNWHA